MGSRTAVRRGDFCRTARALASVRAAAAHSYPTHSAAPGSASPCDAARFLSLWTVYVLRFGRLPISVVAKLGVLFARLDDHVGLNIALVDQLFGQLPADFSPNRRGAVETFFAEVSKDQALLPQLTPEGMDVFDAATRDRPGVRYGSVVTRARPPGVRSTLAAGLDPSAQASHAVYQALYRLASRTPPAP